MSWPTHADAERAFLAIETYYRDVLQRPQALVLSLDARGIDAVLHGGRHAEEARDLEGARPGAGRVGEPLAIDEALVEARSLAPAEDVAGNFEQVGVRRADGRDVPEAVPVVL